MSTGSWIKSTKRNARSPVSNLHRFVDLHVHTSFSDGTFIPAEAVAYALEHGLSAIAVTDHDCIDGIAPAIAAAENTALRIVPGIELSAEIDNFEIHIIGLFIEWTLPWFKQRLEEIRKARFVRMQQMIEKLNRLKVDIAMDDVMALGNVDGALGRLHLARALQAKGAVSTVKEAFDRFIGRNKPCYVKRLIISPQEALQMIREVRGVSILAHPGIMGHDEIIPQLIRQGLMGIEVMHIEHPERSVRYYRDMAKQLNLLSSGGSDCHGGGKGIPLMGLVKVPEHYLEKIWERKILEYGG